MCKKEHKKKYKLLLHRFRFTIISIFIVLIILLIRITYLQIIDSYFLVKESNKRSLYIQNFPKKRGIISDRFGRILAISIPVNSVWIDPQELNKKGGIENNTQWEKLSNSLSIPLEKIKLMIKKKSKGKFVYLARQVNLKTCNYIKDLNLPGVYMYREFRRYYPAGKSTAHIVGITNIDGHGIDGVEKSFDYCLRGYPSTRKIRKDSSGKIIENVYFKQGKDANNITLSIDSRIQSFSYRELNQVVKLEQAESGTVILVDIDSGEILTMVNSPSYNPNNLTNLENIRNHAISDVLEPGSTIKPIVIIAALNKGIVSKDSIIDTSPYFINGFKIKDVKNFKKLNLTEILKQSSNVGVSKLALLMPTSFLMETYLSFGLGKKTNIELVGEREGFFIKRKKWSNIEKATFSYGYGLSVTPIQLAQIYSIIGGMGKIKQLSILKTNKKVEGKPIFSRSIIRTVINMMESVAKPGGCGSKASIHRYRVAVKTGTTKKVNKNGHYVNKYIAYTAGIAPASNPRFALIVIINDPKQGKYYGGDVSAPLFSTIMNYVLHINNIKPDLIENKKIN